MARNPNWFGAIENRGPDVEIEFGEVLERIHGDLELSGLLVVVRKKGGVVQEFIERTKERLAPPLSESMFSEIHLCRHPHLLRGSRPSFLPPFVLFLRRSHHHIDLKHTSTTFHLTPNASLGHRPYPTLRTRLCMIWDALTLTVTAAHKRAISRQLHAVLVHFLSFIIQCSPRAEHS